MCEVAAVCPSCGATVGPEHETACVTHDRGSRVEWRCQACGAQIALSASFDPPSYKGSPPAPRDLDLDTPNPSQEAR